MIASALLLAVATMTSADAMVCLLNSRSSCSTSTYETALALVGKEAAEGRPLQQFVYGVTTDDKELSRKYLDASRERIRFLAETRDNPLAWYLLSLEKNDLKLLQRAADGDNVQALNALGTIATAEAVNTPAMPKAALQRVLKRSFEFFKRAAAKRDANGFVNVGTCYLRGLGCEQDMAMAFECFRAAAELGHPEGMDYVSACYQFGHGVPPNAERSLYWAMRGRALRGDKAAEKWLRERK